MNQWSSYSTPVIKNETNKCHTKIMEGWTPHDMATKKNEPENENCSCQFLISPFTAYIFLNRRC